VRRPWLAAWLAPGGARIEDEGRGPLAVRRWRGTLSPLFPRPARQASPRLARCATVPALVSLMSKAPGASPRDHGAAFGGRAGRRGRRALGQRARPGPPLNHPPPLPLPLSPPLRPLLNSDKRSGEEVAIKLIKRPLPKIILPNILREIRIQADLGEGHINIVDAKAALLTEAHLALVMEYAAGGSLTGYVAERWQHAQHAGLFLGEDEARYFFRQFIGAVEYCHSHCVAHRDLKLDNTLLSSDSPPVLKLCDFGFAKTWTEDANMYTHIGMR